MRKAALLWIGLLLPLLLCSCKVTEHSPVTPTEITTGKTVTFLNEIGDADVWILPQTQPNLKTTVWGTPSASDVRKGETRQTPLCKPGDDALYLFRMIDADGFYYSANGITLDADWTIAIREDDLHTVTLDVTDENGVSVHAYEVFAAKL